MTRNLHEIFSKKEYDLLVIGGGINGAAIANIASRSGLSVALVEKQDFASGTSSRSTKLVHGGLRYLESFEFDLVAESLRERFIQWKNVPYLVKPLRFVIPVYRGDRRPLWMMKLGGWLYDLLSGKYIVEKHKSLSKEEVLDAIPSLKREGLVGGVAYSDCRMDDARLCLENILSAREHGAHVANYAQVVSFLKVGTQVTAGAIVKDVLTGQEIMIKAHRVVCAAGPWANEMMRLDTPNAQDKVRLTKGVHIVYREKISDTALLLQAGKDNRVFFVIPFEDHSLIGTTDTDYTDLPDEVESDRDDVEYLLSQAAQFLPDLKLSREKIVTTFAGLRPLVFAPGAPSKISRKHVIEENKSGVIYVLGGKYTTYRAIAQECVEKVLEGKKLNLTTAYSLYGTGNFVVDGQKIAQEYGISVESVSCLLAKYGAKYLDVLALIEKNRTLAELLCTCSPVIKAQVVYSIESEMAVSADDIIWRRLGLGYRFCQTKNCRKIIEEFCKNRRSV